MEIIVKDNDAIRSQYSSAKFIRYLYIIPVILFFAALLTYDAIWIILFSIPLYIFGFLFLRPLRIASFSDDAFTAAWPREEVRSYNEIRRVISMSPYCNILSSIVIVYTKGLLFEKINIAWIPVDQCIIEHLKAHGVKIWNLWFWQEK